MPASNKCFIPVPQLLLLLVLASATIALPITSSHKPLATASSPTPTLDLRYFITTVPSAVPSRSVNFGPRNVLSSSSSSSSIFPATSKPSSEPSTSPTTRPLFPPPAPLPLASKMATAAAVTAVAPVDEARDSQSPSTQAQTQILTEGQRQQGLDGEKLDDMRHGVLEQHTQESGATQLKDGSSAAGEGGEPGETRLTKALVAVFIALGVLFLFMIMLAVFM